MRGSFSEQFALHWSITWILQGTDSCRGSFFFFFAWNNCKPIFSPLKTFFLIFLPEDKIKFPFLLFTLLYFLCKFDNDISPLLFLSRIYPYMWRQFKRKEWDDRKPRISIWISKWSELYLGDCCWGGEQDSYSFPVFCSGRGIWFFISLWWPSTPGQLQDKVRTHFLIQAHPKMWNRAEK